MEGIYPLYMHGLLTCYESQTASYELPQVAETDKKIALTPLQKSTKGDSFYGSEAEFAIAVRGQSRKYSRILPSTDKYTRPELLLVLVHVRSRRFSQKESSIVCYMQTGSN